MTLEQVYFVSGAVVAGIAVIKLPRWWKKHALKQARPGRRSITITRIGRLYWRGKIREVQQVGGNTVQLPQDVVTLLLALAHGRAISIDEVLTQVLRDELRRQSIGKGTTPPSSKKSGGSSKKRPASSTRKKTK